MASSAVAMGGRSSSLTMNLNHRSLSAILLQSLATFFSSSVIRPLLLSSLILFLYRSLLFTITLQFTSLIQTDPSIQSLLSLPPPPPSSPPPPPLPLFSLNETHHQPTATLFFYSKDVAVLDNHRGKHRTGKDTALHFSLIECLLSFIVFASLGFIRLYPTLHSTAFLASSSRHLNKPSPPIIPTFRHAYELTGLRNRLRAFTGLWVLTRRLAFSVFFHALLSMQTTGSSISDASVGLAAAVQVGVAPLVAPFRMMGDNAGLPESLIIAWGVLVDPLLSMISCVDITPWVVLFRDDGGRMSWEVVRQGHNLLALMPVQAVGIKLLEVVACGEIGRRLLSAMIGGSGLSSSLFVGAVQSMAEAYFVVVWLVFYLAARCKDAESKGRTFGRQDLEDCLRRIG